MLKLKVQYFGHLMQRVDSLEKSNAEDPSSIPGSGRSAGERIGYPCQYSWAFPVAQLCTWFQSLGWEDPLEKGKATHSSILP